jgi:hypothetical protein
MQTSQEQRRALISRHLGVNAPYSRKATQIANGLNSLLAKTSDLDPTEQARLLSEAMVALSAKLSALHGNR